MTGDDDQGVAVVLALAAMFLIDAVETGMFATDDKGGKIEGSTQGRRTPFADLAAAVDRVARLVRTWIQPRIGDVLVRRAEVANGIAFGMNDGHQVGDFRSADQGRAEFLHAQVELVFDGGALLAQRGAV